MPPIAKRMMVRLGACLLLVALVEVASVAPVRWRGESAGRATARAAVCMGAAEDLLQGFKGGANAEQLVRQLSRDELREACSARSLRVGGNKAELAERLMASLQFSPAPPGGADLTPPPSPKLPQRGVAPALTRSANVSPRLQAIEIADARSLQPGAAAQRGRKGTATEPDPGHKGTGADLEVIVLGSGACNPSPMRSASSLALRVRDSYWIFDVGEGTQVQLQRCFVGPSRIDRIFVTHAHGDHCFGLPGLLCLIARGRDRDAPPMEIYGPAGLRAFLRVTLRFSGTTFLPRFLVNELHDIPFLHSSRPMPPPLAVSGDDVRPGDFGEQPGGRNIKPEPDGTWELFSAPFGDDGTLRVRAAPLRHTAPTVGYVVEEDTKRGRLQPEVIMPLLERNREALRAEWGVADPRVLLKRIKLLGSEDELRLPDGSLIRGSDAIGGERRGRKVAVLGDCCDASPCLQIARGADLLVHESTNAYLPQYGDTGGAANLERETFSHGHSTPRMAGAVAREFGAQALLLTHFSQRYSPDAVGMMRAIQAAAVEESGLPSDRVITARDTLVLPIWQPDRGKPIMQPGAAGSAAAPSEYAREQR